MDSATVQALMLGVLVAIASGASAQNKCTANGCSNRRMTSRSRSRSFRVISRRAARLAGKITGAIAGHKPPFNWDLEFDLTLPQKAAGAGPGC
jgi:hypothetical protein